MTSPEPELLFGNALQQLFVHPINALHQLLWIGRRRVNHFGNLLLVAIGVCRRHVNQSLSEVTNKRNFSNRQLFFLKKKKWQAITSRRSILRHNSMSRIVPFRFISTALLSASSNLTVAAEWKTIDTLSLRILTSEVDTPSPGRHISPAMGTNLLSTSGESLRS